MPFVNTPRGTITSDDLTIHVFATDHRKVYGRHEYLVTPVAGHGTKWVHATRIAWTEAPIHTVVPKLAEVGL